MGKIASMNGEISSKADTWNEVWELPMLSEDDPAADIAGRTLVELMKNQRIRESDVMRIHNLLRLAVSYGERQAEERLAS